MSQNGRKLNGLHRPENQFLFARIRLFFKNWIPRFTQTEKKPQNKIILFQVDNIVSTSGNEEFV